MMFKIEKFEKLNMLIDELIFFNMNLNEKCLLKFLTNPIGIFNQDNVSALNGCPEFCMANSKINNQVFNKNIIKK